MILSKFSMPLIASTIAAGASGIVATHNWNKDNSKNNDNEL